MGRNMLRNRGGPKGVRSLLQSTDILCELGATRIEQVELLKKRSEKLTYEYIPTSFLYASHKVVRV